MVTKLRAKFDGKALIPLDPVDLPTGRVLEVEVHDHSGLRRGSPELLLKIMHEPPHVTADDVAEMERMIAESQIPPRDENPFDVQK
jgi:hypothetical protein